MRLAPKPATVALFCGLTLCVCPAQQASQQRENASATRPRTNENYARRSDKTLTADEGLAVISAALDRRVRRYSGQDCSHLVHAIYERAGFPYQYATSDDLYDGVPKFQRVAEPQPGDLIVWHGHAGIVVRPSRHVFFSFMSAGPGIDNYESRYWSRRGHARFYRYIKNERCPGCTAVSKNVRTRR
ncbi:MAG TPA: NlpC/P60 family protein [Candidatus Sulfotelmatobacter sp.]|jgi:cell wall-associated NlpC family hydrolase